jgi:hypothetical protein
MNWLKSSFIDIKLGNVSAVFGSKNITIQDIQGSTINIGGNINPAEVIDALKEDRLLSIFIFVVRNNNELQETLNWQPFENQTLSQIISRCSKKHEVRFRLFLIDENDENDISDIELAYFKYLKHRAILIVDYCEELGSNTEQFLSAYNDFQIGGCIFLNKSNDCQVISKNLNHVCMYNDDKKALHEFMDANVSKLDKNANKDSSLINVIGELVEKIGAEKSSIQIDTKNPISSSLSEMNI